MTVRQWYMGMAVASAAFIPLSANAGVIPDLAQGDPGQISLKFSGVTVEDSPFVTGLANGGSCTGAGGTGTCTETTWGAGTITGTIDANTNNSLWSGGSTANANGTHSTLVFVLYGIADESITAGGTFGQNIDNVGATTAGTFGATNGKINLDFYSFTAATAAAVNAITPCFTASCTNSITPTARGANATITDGSTTITDAATVTGITQGTTNGGTLFAHIELIPGASAIESNATLFQNVSAASLPAHGSGNFFANCVSGPGCSEFSSTLFGSIAADFSAVFDLTDNTSSSAPQFNQNEFTQNNWPGGTSDPLTAQPAIPEPASLALLGTGLAFFGAAIRRRRRKGISA